MTKVGDQYLGDPETYGDPPKTGRATAEFEAEVDDAGNKTGDYEYTFTEANGTVHTGVIKEKDCSNQNAGSGTPV